MTHVDLLADVRLSNEARILGLWIASQEPDADGYVALSFDQASALLFGYPGPDAIRRHLRMLTGFGWAERKPGGRGHPDRFKPKCPLFTLGADTQGKNSLGAEPYPNSRIGYGPSSTLSDRVRAEQYPKCDVVVVEEEVEVGVEENAREAIGEQFAGCRGALRDYLAARVPPSRQVGYVQTLAGWLAGLGPEIFRLPDGGNLPPDERTPYLAMGLNELLAGDESQMSRPVGDPGNLKTKLNILLKQRGKNARPASGSPASSPGGHPGRPSIASGQGRHVVE